MSKLSAGDGSECGICKSLCDKLYKFSATRQRRVVKKQFIGRIVEEEMKILLQVFTDGYISRTILSSVLKELS